MNPNRFAVEFESVSKVFGQVKANQDVSFSVEAGSVHGIVGENGAGKSTAMKILYGMYPHDAGKMRVWGKDVKWRSPSNAILAKIGMVHQHFMLAGTCTALDNILLGVEPQKNGVLSRKDALNEVNALAERYGLGVPLEAKIEDLSVGEQQRVEILKLLYRNAEILILDEPTAVLTPLEVDRFLAQLETLKNQGKTILMISHKLREVMAATDRITIFRAGKVVETVQTTQITARELAEKMVGRSLVQLPARKVWGNSPDSRPPYLKVSQLGLGRLKSVSFSLQRGEILGIAGVEGNGQSELIEALRTFGNRNKMESISGSIQFEGVSPHEVAFVPSDRLKEAVLLNASVAENIALGLQRSNLFLKYGQILWKKVHEIGARLMKEFDVTPSDLKNTVSGLSGGNQQKLVIGREFLRNPKLLIVAQPTRGVDIGAIEFIHSRILKARDEGAGVLLVSSELDEIRALSDRILVFYNGRVAGEFKQNEADEKKLGTAMMGLQSEGI